MKRFVILTGIIILLASCARAPHKYYPPAEDFVTASWYGPDFNGRPTASGEKFDMYGFTAAHREMDFGTKLRVTNPDNGKSVVVTVNDRGPFIPGRDLDLSYGAAREIDHIGKGVGLVKIEYLGRDMRYAKRMPFEPFISRSPLTVQIGSFVEPSNADRLKRGLEFKYSDVYITTVFVKGQKFYRVRIGKFSDYDNAYSLAEKLAEEGYSTLITSRN
jgi:rare lipoprotein A